MKKLIQLIILLVFIINSLFGQADTTIYGVTRDGATQELYLSKINPLNGTVTNISPTPFSNSIFITSGLATIDPVNEIFYLKTQDSLLGIDLTSGNVIQSNFISTPINGFFDLMRFNCMDTTIYGVTRDGATQELYLSKINPLNGTVTNISLTPFSNSIFITSGLATIDPVNEIFYLKTQDSLLGIDLISGNVIRSSFISTPINGFFDLMSFNYMDSTIYGVTRDGATQELYLSKINPLNGTVTNISPTPFSNSIFITSGLATIDPVNEIFYLKTQDSLLGINLMSGIVIQSSFTSTPINGFFDLMNFNPLLCSDLPVSIKTMANESRNNIISIYPNPTSYQLRIRNRQLNINEISIVDISGKTAKTFTTDLNIINVTDLPSGIYFIRFISDEKTIIKKFAKQ